jgi:hypothetical protein
VADNIVRFFLSGVAGPSVTVPDGMRVVEFRDGGVVIEAPLSLISGGGSIEQQEARRG